MDQIKGLAKNSRDVKEGYIYFCFNGQKNSGYDYIDDAVKRGACKIVGERELHIENYEKVKDVNISMIEYAKKIYLNPQEKLKLIGVTGTDGKTSTALLINYFLNIFSTSSYLGTNGFIIEDKEEDYTDFTTPFADKFYFYLNESIKKESKYFVTEVSSHALDQNRLGDLLFDVCLYTNISQEHLDYHKTIENYYEAKKKLFLQVKENGSIIINIDDEYGKKLEEELNHNDILTISQKDKNASFYIDNIKIGINNTKFDLIYKSKVYKINSPLIADFNVYNLTEAIASVVALGFPIQDILNNIEDIFIPGRLEVINYKTRTIIIDFAHTPEAIHKVMKFVKSVSNNKISVLTGSAGGRDSKKRSKMGEYAAQYTDCLYLTEDDPRDESVIEINKQIKAGVLNENCKVYEIQNRALAIKEMILNSKKEDVLILFGKGTMKYMYYDGYKKPYIEKEQIMEIIKELDDKFIN